MMVTLLFASCGSGLFDKTAQAYEEATKELENATTNEDCDKIHDELMQKLHDITVEYPDWKKIISEKDEDSSDMKKVSEAYKKWDEKLQEKAKDRYMFMTICNLENAADYGKSKAAPEVSSDDDSEDTSEATIDGNEDWDQIITEYGEFYDQYIEYIKKVKEGDMSAMADLQEIMTKAQEISSKVENAKDELTDEQLQKFAEVQKKLLEAAKEME